MGESDEGDDYSLPPLHRVCVGDEDGVALIGRL